MKISQKAKEAILLGGTCAVTYLMVYVTRNVLGTVSNQMVGQGIFDKEFVGTLSSVFFISYAVGQLVNGTIGNYIKSKYMICGGLMLAAAANYAFSLYPASVPVAFVAYGACGFFLSMIYAPMVKLMADSVEPIYATRCGTSYSFSMFFGSPLAGLLAAFLTWRGVFAVSSVALIVMAAVCFVLFNVFEKREIIKYPVRVKAERRGGNLQALLAHQIIRFTFVSMFTGIIRTTVIFWLPTYIAEYLDFPEKEASLIFSVATLAISFSAFLALFVYEKLGRDMNRSVLLFFCGAAVMFLLVYLVKQPLLNMAFIILAILASNSAASILWSMYCPSLAPTGMVSGATGFLDFVSYLSAAISSILFANAVDSIGWGNLILIWFGLMVLGVIVALPYRRKGRA